MTDQDSVAWVGLAGVVPGSEVAVQFRGDDGGFVDTTLRRLPAEEVLAGRPVREFRSWQGRRYYSGFPLRLSGVDGGSRRNAHTVTVAVGVALLLDGVAARVVEFDGRKVVVEYADGHYGSFALTEFISRARGLESADQGYDPGLVLSRLPAEERERIACRREHVREVLTGYKSGYAEAARKGEPRPAYAAEAPLKARYEAKAAELSVTSRTIEKWVAAYREAGEVGLVDARRRIFGKRRNDENAGSNER